MASRVFEEDERSDGLDAMNLKWVIGFNKDIRNGVHNLTSEDRSDIFYTSAHTGVIYNYRTGGQKLLQGHCNQISCCAVSKEKDLIVTADSGDDSLMVVWDSETATPLKTIFSPHGKGVSCMDISQDGNFICTLSATEPQEIAVWEWRKDSENHEDYVVAASEIPGTRHYSIRFRTYHEEELDGQELVGEMLEIATNNEDSVIFWKWSESERALTSDINKKELKSLIKQSTGSYTQTIFIPGGNQAVTGTKNGQIIVWDMSFIMEADSSPEQRKPMKLVQLVNHEASFLITQGPYLVVGFKDGAVRFYDQRFIVEAWYEKIKAGDILSISFAKEDFLGQNSQTDLKNSFICPDFIIASDNANIIKLKAADFDRIPPIDKAEEFVQGETLVKGFKYFVSAVAVHPKKPQIAVAGGEHYERDDRQDDDDEEDKRDERRKVASNEPVESYLHVWNYKERRRIKPNKENKESKEGMTSKVLQDQKSLPTCMEYTPNGDTLVVGLKNGVFLLLDSENFYTNKQAPIKYTEKLSRITRIIFSRDGKAMAVANKLNRVALFKYDLRRGNTEKMEWIFCGQHESHYKQINGLTFGESIDEKEKTVLRLFSVGDDRKLIEYDTNSTDTTQLQILSNNKIEQEHKPTCCLWYPVSTGEDLLLTMNDAYKIKLWNANNKDCRLTCLGPTSGGPITKLRLIAKYKDARTAIDAPDYYLIYSTDEKVIGLIMLPVDGNPNKHVGLIGHPGKITDIAVSGDNKFLFTSGGKDLCVNMWFIDQQAIERQIALGGAGEEPFENMIEGGKFGKPYKDMKDFFYYSQIRSKKENTTKARKLEGSVPLSEIGFLMRAMGYYPSQQEIDNMINEVKYSKFTDTGKVVNYLDMDTLLRVFVNHRPVYGVDRNEIQSAFKVIAGELGSIPRDRLIELMLTKGESMNDGELKSCLISLLGPSEDIYESLPNEINPDFFLEKILGFEEIQDEVIEGDSQIIEVEEDDT